MEDNLTGDYNRKKLEEFEEKFYNTAKSFGFFYLDINKFMLINYTYALYPSDTIKIENLLPIADSNMYEEKSKA